MTIYCKDVSFVIQGLVDNNSIATVVNCIRKKFPQAEIILSTWKGSILSDDVTSIIDVLIENDDPGDFTDSSDMPINVNRQLVSSRNGILKTTRKYVVKTRTDIIFKNSNILKQLERQFSRDKSFSIGSGYILASDFSTRSHLKGLKVPFWVCDFIYAGLRDDMLKLFSLDNYPLEYFTAFDKGHPNNYLDKKHIYKYSPETYIAYKYLDADCNVPFEHTYDNNVDALNHYHKYLLNNFVILNKRQLGVDSTKYYLPFSSRHIMFTNTDWRLARSEFSLISKDSFYEMLELIDWIYIRLTKKRKR
ncbi:WavE lipopolysaccharide synthesis [Vibrio owensii]|uniref:WavE lipopolysaccharide synthesis family protein n=1 Tax=Vibrio owensii TaxID=696485 RepID=UPI002894342B|nr:WavE lipopolysaccharide synthesis [Vibrio owensii]CAH1554794.1 WavE lipopolysaccharide synthesis [Vibrio owensii]